MTTRSPQEKEFLDQLFAKVKLHISEEEFGVSELADSMHMSRSNLLRKVKKLSGLSVSQLINQIRLEEAMQLLRAGTMNVSEVADSVGFNSPSYFIKCFREHYGYPPGEVGKHPEPSESHGSKEVPKQWWRQYWVWGLLGVVLIAAGWMIFKGENLEEAVQREKSIVVLPFKNESADSSNIYLINGLMEATLNNLQKIKDLRVLSRTSAEKYRDSQKSIPEMAEELNVSYLVEGSGQKMGDRIVLNIQLIEGSTDRHLWSKQYRREVRDIFTLQQEISKDIASEIKAVITPAERSRIEKIPTENIKAYDLFLKGLDHLNSGGEENIIRSIDYFNEAIEEDKTFALAYSCAGMAFYYYDMFRAEKIYLEDLGVYSDQAMLYDPTSAESHTAKAMYYLSRKEYSLALPFLEKGLEYRPNSSQIIGLLADFYANHLPNTGKYLEYALKGMRLDVGSSDSIATSYFYLRLGNALVQAGFAKEAMAYIDQSVEYFPGNLYSRYVRAFISYALTEDLAQTRKMLLEEYSKDTSRFDILQDIGKVSYYMRDYEGAYSYYEKFNKIREEQKLNVYVHENMLIGVVYEKMGKLEEARKLIQSYREYLDVDQTVYRNLGLTMYYAHAGEMDRAIEHFRLFAKEDNIQVWVILFLREDPMVDELKKHPEFQKIWVEVEGRFQSTNKKIKEGLEEEGLI